MDRPEMIGDKVTLVTVTYADRANFVCELLESAFECEEIANIIIVNNGGTLVQLRNEWPAAKVTLINLEQNFGSAKAFGLGIGHALKISNAFIMLMDDDNVIGRDAVKILIDNYRENSNIHPLYACAGLRRDKGMRHYIRQVEEREGSFMGFHVFDFWRKIRKMLGIDDEPPSPADNTLLLKYAPYGGFFSHGATFKKIGLPSEDFVLYADDWEYTSRVVALGGRITLVGDAEIVDQEVSWAVGENKPSFNKFLEDGSDFRVFYTFRNHVFLSTRSLLPRHALIFMLNAIFFFSLLTIFNIRVGRYSRLLLIFTAVYKGICGQLGESPRFQLPQHPRI